MKAHTAVFGLAIFRFCRSWADGSSGGTSIVKIFSDLSRFECETRGSLVIYGHAWQRVAGNLGLEFSSLVD